MNKYQKKLHKEIKEFAKYNKELTYKDIRKAFKWLVKINLWTPCENCLNGCCTRKANKIVYCREQR